MKRNVKYSIIICAYNIEKYINRAIESVIQQKFEDYEIIIVNDGSTDNTKMKLNFIKNRYKDKNIVIINNPCNKGLGASRNIAVEVAKGEYILYLDGDDTMYDEHTLYNINEVIKKDEADITFFGVQYIGGSNKMYLSNAENSTKQARISCDIFFGVPSKCWRTSFLKENDIKFIENMYYEDMVYSMKATILSKKLSYGEFPIFNYYRNREGSIMSTPSIKRCSDMYKMLENIMQLYSITPDEYKPYLMSFIRNETRNTIEKIDVILNSIENNVPLGTMPKRNYKLDFGKLNDIQGEIKYAN